MARYDEIDQRISREEELEVRQASSRMNGNDRRPIPGDVTVRGVNIGDGEYSESESLESFALRSNETFESYIIENRGNAGELSGLATGAYLRSMILGPKTDLERRALSEGTDSAGGYTVPDILSARMIDRMRSASVVVRAGAQSVPLESDVSYVAKIVSDPVPAWRVENASVAESDPTFGRVHGAQSGRPGKGQPRTPRGQSQHGVCASQFARDCLGPGTRPRNRSAKLHPSLTITGSYRTGGAFNTSPNFEKNSSVNLRAAPATKRCPNCASLPPISASAS